MKFDAIWNFVNKTDDCWVWLAGATSAGYGMVWHEGRKWLVHRLVYTKLVGPIPNGLTLDHLCFNRRCVRPSHLEPVTHAENIRRGFVHKGRRTHCLRGHPFTEDNKVFINAEKNWYKCKTCHHAYGRKRRRRNKRLYGHITTPVGKFHCVICGVAFIRYYIETTTCSNSCRGVLSNRNRRNNVKQE